jgi:hypothetical protein
VFGMGTLSQVHDRSARPLLRLRRVGRGERTLTAEYRKRQLANADHLALLESMWQDAVARPRSERYRRCSPGSCHRSSPTAPWTPPSATWLWRTLRAAEAVGALKGR